MTNYQNRPPLEFFDIINDPLEMHNLADHPEHQATIDELKQRLNAWMKAQGDQGIATEMSANSHKKKRPANEKKPKGNNKRKKRDTQSKPPASQASP